MTKKLEKKILDHLNNSEYSTLKEIADSLGESEKSTFKILRKLFTRGEVSSYTVFGKRVYFKGSFRALDKKKEK